MEALPSVSVEVRALSGEVVCETFLVSRGITVKELKEACMKAARVKGTLRDLSFNTFGLALCRSALCNHAQQPLLTIDEPPEGTPILLTYIHHAPKRAKSLCHARCKVRRLVASCAV